MVEPDILQAKTAIIQRCLKRIRDTTGGDPERLSDLDVQDIFVINLQRAVQATIDIAAHIVAAHGWGLPDSLKANFDLLSQNGAIDVSLAGKLKAMVGFRNIAVHNYEALNIPVLKSILTNNLDDLVNFYKAVITRFGM